MKLQGRNLSSEMQGADVQLLQSELAQLGAAVPSAESQRQFYGPGTRQAVLLFQRRHIKDGLPLTGIVDEKTAALINKEVDALHPATPTPPPVPAPEPTPVSVPPPVGDPTAEAGFLVHGLVTRSGVAALVDGSVRVFDQDMLGREPLGESRIGLDGGYAVAYEAKGFALGEIGTADLVFEVSDRLGASVAVSRVVAYDAVDRPRTIAGPVFNAPAVVRVDLVVESKEPPGESEYERLAAFLTPAMQGVPAAALTEANIEFLSGESGIDRQIIELFATGGRLERETKIPAAVFYGIGREGLALEPTFLATVTAAIFQSVLEQALADNIIPAALRDSLDAIVKLLVETFLRAGLSRPAVEGAPALGAVLAVATAQTDLHAKFLSLWANHEGTPAEFWKKLGDDPSFQNGLAAKVQQTLQLTLLTRGSIPLVQKIQALGQQPLASLRDLARFDANDWLKLLPENDGDLPPNLSGNTPAERRLDYARELEGRVDQAFRTVAVARRMSKENPPQNADVVKFLDTNPEFEFDKTHIDSYVAARPAAVAAAPDLTNKLKAIQRVFTVTPHYSEISVLVAGGISSARSAARLGPEAFVARFGTALGGSDRAQELYNRAERTAAIAAGVFARFAPAMNSLDVHVIRRLS